jgi:hypothetical protein
MLKKISILTSLVVPDRKKEMSGYKKNHLCSLLIYIYLYIYTRSNWTYIDWDTYPRPDTFRQNLII